MKKRGVAESESKQLKIAAFLEEVEVKKRPYCRFFCKNLTARGNIKSHPKIGANSRRNKRKCFFELLIKYSSAWFHFKKDSSLKTVMNNIVLKEESGICIHLNQLKLKNIFSDYFWVSKSSQNCGKICLYHFCNASKYWRCLNCKIDSSLSTGKIIIRVHDGHSETARHPVLYPLLFLNSVH